MNKKAMILWQDLTVTNAKQIKGFYAEVVGWVSQDVKIPDRTDYNMASPDDIETPIAGICNKVGELKDFPSQWLNYVTVPDIENGESYSGIDIFQPSTHNLNHFIQSCDFN